MAKRNLIWLSFDMGVQGDYEGLYAFLDDVEAVECGDNVAVFRYTYKKDLLKELRDELSKSIEIDKRTRMYVIRLEGGLMKGKFIFGRRKNSPWAGFGSARNEELVEDA
jgi:hypothetical protein